MTSEMGKVLSALPTIKLKGSCKLMNAIQVAQVRHTVTQTDKEKKAALHGALMCTHTAAVLVVRWRRAQLALKHRQNKSQRQRIVLFVGSTLEEDERTLVRLGKKLKKYNVAVDVVNFGEQNDNAAKLEAFVNAVDSGNRCEASPGYHRRTRISPHPRV